MRIAVSLLAILAEHTPEGADALAVPDGTTVGGLLEILGLGRNQVMMAFVNGGVATCDTLLTEGCRVTLCPFICGG